MVTEEPDALIALVRVCGEGAGEPVPLPGNGPTTCLPKLSKMLLESGDHAALSVTYTADRAVSIPFACLEMYYVVTHPELFQPPSGSSNEVITPLKLSTDINS